MFEAILLFALLGIILWVIIAGGLKTPVRRTSFISLSAELKPARKRRKGN